MPAVAACHHLSPVPIELLLAQRSDLTPLHPDAIIRYRDPLKVLCTPVNIAEREKQHHHLEARERKDRPCAERRKCDGDAYRYGKYENKDVKPAGGSERIVALRDQRKPGRLRHANTP